MSGVKCHTLDVKRGAATLPTILALAVLFLAVAIGVSVLAFNESFIAAEAVQATKSLFYAEAGARDALERVARDKTFSTSSYTIEFVTDGCSGAIDGCATVDVSSASGTSANPKVITSQGKVGNNFRKIQVDVVLDSSLDGEISTTTWREVTNY